MPVMIRNNDAAELCIIKDKKILLLVVFVELDKPPKLVQIPGLPDNIVSIVKSSKTIQYIFPSDFKETIEREQAWILHNFAMTAHAAQKQI
jgi:hypothetical protein